MPDPDSNRSRPSNSFQRTALPAPASPRRETLPHLTLARIPTPTVPRKTYLPSCYCSTLLYHSHFARLRPRQVRTRPIPRQRKSQPPVGFSVIEDRKPSTPHSC